MATTMGIRLLRGSGSSGGLRAFDESRGWSVALGAANLILGGVALTPGA